jgi:hypothetical protein
MPDEDMMRAFTVGERGRCRTRDGRAAIAAVASAEGASEGTCRPSLSLAIRVFEVLPAEFIHRSIAHHAGHVGHGLPHGILTPPLAILFVTTLDTFHDAS